jgi:Transglutaminase-like superfamily
MRRAWLVISALYELMRYDVMLRLRGFAGIQEQLRTQRVAPSRRGSEETICDALLFATCVYWKPVLCLQRSVCEVRLLRRYGFLGRVAIGYRPAPFFSHAWTEIDGRAVNGGTAYQQRLQLLCRL